MISMMTKQQHFRFKQLMLSLAVLILLSLLSNNTNSVILTLTKTTMINASVSGLWNSSEQFDDSNAVPDNENSVANEGTDDAAALDLKNWPPTEMLDLLLAEATISSTTNSKQGIPRLVVAASNSDYVVFADNFANSLLAPSVGAIHYTIVLDNYEQFPAARFFVWYPTNLLLSEQKTNHFAIGR
jgi:hypothetical protein